ncbi:PAS domain S-box protein [Maribacter hydrothermalis]|uniref:histidine kinase n=1 Tax=Maribacter hydrothermalis TaxID=1836467 RepID=A0A1B7ZET9_9FLAO|nr:PAS domain S-box protein [Maribacter hydrothermalis]APQ17588.1 hypothetical protein BTR34_09715 [Maribacter hydrothermalis]OBR42063.1 hypothetical protein A9200_01345 [Maribacter hydrothermalis]
MTTRKKDTELQEIHHQIFIEQAPTAIAMLNTDMVYLAASQRWLKDFKLVDEKIVGRSHYDIFPEIGDDWKAKHQLCLNGAIDVCDEAPFYRKDGSIQWIYWDVRPWYNSNGEIGGLLMHTGDITIQKEKELEKKRFESILKDTSEIARIGTWEVELGNNDVIWSQIIYDIHEVPADYKPTLDSTLEFCENDKSRKLVENALNDIIVNGNEVNFEYEIRTAKGNLRFLKVIGKIEYVDGIASRLFGILQDVTSLKHSEQRLNKAHAELEAIFNSKYTAIITTGKDGIINRFNSGAEQLLGYTAKEMVGLKKPSVYLLEDELEQFKTDMILEFAKDSTDSNFNYRNENVNDTRQWTFVRKNGTTFPVLSTITAVNDKKGLNEGFIAVATDISKIKEVKNELRRKNDLLILAEQISLMGHWQWNTVLDHVKWSQNLYTLVELDENFIDLKFDTYFGFVHPEDKEIVTTYFNKAASDKKFYNFVHRIITTSGVVKTIQLMGKVITNESDEIVEMIGTAQDVTEAKKAEQKLIEAKEELEIIAHKLSHQNKQLADFTHITSHNLRAPVANLNSLLEIYNLSENEKERLDIFDKFETVTHHLSFTLNTLIEALKTKISDSEEDLEDIDFKQVLQNTNEILSGVILESGAIINSDFTQVRSISYNRIYLDSIFLNLIGNAIKYKSEDRIPEIFITSKLEDGKITLTFKDNGLGIDLDRHRHKLFGLNKVFHRHPDAKGVGLFLTRTQVEAMGGTISATSQVDKGTIFTINFN